MNVNIYENGQLLDTISFTTLPDLKEKVFNHYNRNRSNDNTYRYVYEDNTRNFDLYPDRHNSASEYILKPLEIEENDTQFRYDLQKWLEKKLEEIQTTEKKLDERKDTLDRKEDKLYGKESELNCRERELERERKRLFRERKRFYFAKKDALAKLKSKVSEKDFANLNLDQLQTNEFLFDKEYYQLYDMKGDKKEYQSSYELKKDIFHQKDINQVRALQTESKKKVIIDLKEFDTIDELLRTKLFDLQNIQENLQRLQRETSIG